MKKMILVLAVLLIVAVFFTFSINQNLTELTDQHNSLQGDYSSLESKNKDLHDSYETLQTDFAELESQNEELTSNLNVAEEKYDKLSDSSVELYVENNKLSGEIADLENIILCDHQIDISYSSNNTASNSLQNAIYDAVINAEWFVFWDNAETSLHRILTNQSLYVFIVYFD